MIRDNLAEVIRKVSGQPELVKAISRRKAQFDPQRRSVVLYFESTSHCLPADFQLLKDSLSECSTDGISLRVSQHEFAKSLADDPELFEKCVKDCCVMQAPPILPFLAPASVHLENETVWVDLTLDEGREIFTSLGMAEIVRGYLKDAYDMDVVVRARTGKGCEAAGYEPPECVASLGTREDSYSEAADFPSVCPPPQAPERPRQQNCPVVRLCDLTEGTRTVIDVQIVSAEDRKSKSGDLTIYNICVTDFTASVSAVLFERDGQPSIGPVPKPGAWAQLTGRLEHDKFSQAPVFKISSIGPSAHVDRCDTAPVKRVELHAHTKMSAMDAVTDIRGFVNKAADWGHEAVAITDHGVTQAFPAAAAAAGNKIKLIYGVEAYMFDDITSPWSGGTEAGFSQDFVSFVLDTTGESPLNADIVRIGAVRVHQGKIESTFETLVAASSPLPPSVTQETGITDEMLAGAPPISQALSAFQQFVDGAALASFDAQVAMGFLNTEGAPHGIKFHSGLLDLAALARLSLPALRSYKLRAISEHLRLPLLSASPANDALSGAKVMLACFDALQDKQVRDLDGLSGLLCPENMINGAKFYHIILLCRDKQGMTDLNRLVSASHISYLNRKKPRMPKSEIAQYRKHLIVGSACESGELYRALIAGDSEKRVHEICSFYDYLEIQPVGNNRFLTRNGVLKDEEAIRDINRQIVSLGDSLNIPVAATCDVHFLEPEDARFREVLQSSMGYDKAEQPPLFFRTTDEMLEEFNYLGEDKAKEIVIDVPRNIADQVGTFELLPEETAMPILDGAADEIEKMAYENARRMYGDPLPEIVDARLKRELGSIIGHGFSVLYYSAHKLVSKSNEDGYLVGSRGSVGSSLTATMTGITEVNPLPPHYVCPNCRHSDFEVDTDTYDCGVDLPDAVCPKCGAKYRKEGFNIPFEVFLGIDADKVPDIDLNFSGEYQNRAHKYTEELFGKNQVFRAGTISGLKDKNTYGYVKHYADETGQEINNAEVVRLQKGLQGVKKTTGQHPGGMVIVPRGHEIYEYTAVQWPANETGADFVTTHFDFRSMHDVLVKLDILGHDAPTIMHLIQEITGLDPLELPLADPETLRLFSTIEPLGIDPSELFGITKGTLGVPEFGTAFVRQMLEDTKPKTVAEIIRISGLSHGTGVWLGNAQELIRDGTCVLREAICARDDIMNYLVAKGVDKREAFFIMENTRKGKVAKNGFSDKEAADMNEAGVPEWFTAACRKIQYLFPKGHAVAYCLMALRIAYCKVHHKEAFYATYFDVNVDKFDATLVSDGLPGIRKNYEAIVHKGNGATDNEKTSATILEVCAEMYLRGLQFLRVDLDKSDPVRFVIEDGGIRLPFMTVPQLGEKVAYAIARERETAPFLSIEDLKRRTKLSTSVAEAMKKTGALAQLAGRDQLSMFDFR